MDIEPHISGQRFQRYTDDGTNDINDPPLIHDILREMFGEDALTDSHNNSGLLFRVATQYPFQNSLTFH